MNKYIFGLILCILIIFIYKETKQLKLDPFSVNNNYVKIIWIYWHQGIENILDYKEGMYNKMCIEGWKKLNPDWDVKILNKNTVLNYVPELINYKHLTIQLLSDLIRIKLLQKYGGVWVDASTIPMRPLTGWIENCDNGTGVFFYRYFPESKVQIPDIKFNKCITGSRIPRETKSWSNIACYFFKNENKLKKYNDNFYFIYSFLKNLFIKKNALPNYIGSWFIVSKQPNHYLINKIWSTLEKNIIKNKKYPYFYFHMIVNDLYKKDPKIKDIINRLEIPALPLRAYYFKKSIPLSLDTMNEKPLCYKRYLKINESDYYKYINDYSKEQVRYQT